MATLNEKGRTNVLEAIVSAEDIADTYENGAKDFADYQKVIELSASHSAREIERKLGLCTKVRFWMYGRKGKECKPLPVKCAEFLERKNLLPLTYNSELIKEVNRIASWLLFSGYVSTGSGTQVTFSNALPAYHIKGKKEKKLKTMEECIEKIGLSFRYREKELRINETGYFSRLLQCMGVPTNEYKTAVDTEPFRYIRDIIDKDIEEYRCLVYDFVRVLFATRFSRWTGGTRLNLISNREEDAAEKSAAKFIKIINHALPELPLKCEISEGRLKDYRFFSPMLYIKTKDTEKVLEKYPDLLDLAR